MNLLQETVNDLKENGKTPADVRWVGRESINAKCGWEDFVKQANFEYDNGYSGVEIPRDLVVVGDDWWLERAECDGSEWWEFKVVPAEPDLDSHASSLRLDLGVVDRLRITQGRRNGYFELLQAPEGVRLNGNGASEQDGEKPSLDGRGGPRVYSFSIKFREDVRINANEFLDLIGKDRIFAFTTKSDDGVAAKELIGTTKSVSFYDGNVVKITVEFPAEVKE